MVGVFLLLSIGLVSSVPYSFGGIIKDSSNTVFDAGSCPSGYTKYLVNTADNRYCDFAPIYMCYQDIPTNTGLYDFGGIYDAPFGQVNPATNALSCPPNFLSQLVRGGYACMTGSYGSVCTSLEKWNNFSYCTASNTDTSYGTWLFGGMYGSGHDRDGWLAPRMRTAGYSVRSDGSTMYFDNPATGGQSCPTGYTSYSILWDGYCTVDQALHYCMKEIVPYCGDGTCNGAENCNSCPSDCGVCCGNGVCNPSYGESYLNCYKDCPKNCSSPKDTILKLFYSNNSHGALYTDTNYKYEICYKDAFGVEYSGGDPHISRADNKILSLSAVTNAHAEVLIPGSYTNKVNYGNLTCSAKATCDEVNGEKCVVTISGDTNAHLAACNAANPFATKICCKECTPTNECGDATHQCGSFTDSCGIVRDCSLYSVTCSGSEVCEVSSDKNLCINRVATLWSDIAGISFSSEQKVDVQVGETIILMNLFNANVPAGNIEFKVYGTSSKYGNTTLITTLTTTVTAENKDKLTTPWKISPDNLIDVDLTKVFKFTVNGKESENNIYLNLLVECTGLISCSGYKDSAKCERDLCNVGNKSVEEIFNLTCGVDYSGHKYGCRCAWNSSSSKCGPDYSRTEPDNDGNPGTPFSSDWQGNCFFNEDIATSCVNDEFMSYSWNGEWNWGKALSVEDAASLALSTTPRNGDFYKLNDKWYYNPATNPTAIESEKIYESQACTNSVGQKTVPCPSQLKLPFFSFWNMIVSLILVAGVYAWMNVRKK